MTKKILAGIQLLVSLFVVGLGLVDFIDSNNTIDIVAVLTMLAGVILFIGSVNIMSRKTSGKTITILGWLLVLSLLIYFVKTFSLGGMIF